MNHETSFQIINIYYISGQNCYSKGGVNLMLILKKCKVLSRVHLIKIQLLMHSIKTINLSTLYTPTLQSKIKDRLKGLAQLCCIQRMASVDILF